MDDDEMLEEMSPKERVEYLAIFKYIQICRQCKEKFRVPDLWITMCDSCTDENLENEIDDGW